MKSFDEIPMMTKSPNYAVDIMWGYLEHSLNRWQEGYGLELDPDFQRGHVWNEDKQRKYVEFILRGGHSSKDIYWNNSEWMSGHPVPMILVDGKQRLEAVRKFLRNELEIFDGTKLRDFNEVRFPLHASFKFHVNDLKTRSDVLQWYLDLNTGGVIHTSEEIEKVQRLLDEEKEKS